MDENRYDRIMTPMRDVGEQLLRQVLVVGDEFQQLGKGSKKSSVPMREICKLRKFRKLSFVRA